MASHDEKASPEALQKLVLEFSGVGSADSFEEILTKSNIPYDERRYAALKSSLGRRVPVAARNQLWKDFFFAMFGTTYHATIHNQEDAKQWEAATAAPATWYAPKWEAIFDTFLHVVQDLQVRIAQRSGDVIKPYFDSTHERHPGVGWRSRHHLGRAFEASYAPPGSKFTAYVPLDELPGQGAKTALEISVQLPRLPREPRLFHASMASTFRIPLGHEDALDDFHSEIDTPVFWLKVDKHRHEDRLRIQLALKNYPFEFSGIYLRETEWRALAT
jgi:hypothetical protein